MMHEAEPSPEYSSRKAIAHLVIATVLACAAISVSLWNWRRGYPVWVLAPHFLVAPVGLSLGFLVRGSLERKRGTFSPERWRATWRAAAVLSAGCWIAGLLALRPSPTPGFERVPAAGQPLVEAILAYEADHAEPPVSLRRLVPDYIDAIPGTGIPGAREFSYRRHRRYEPYSYVWYSLGPRGEQEPDFCLFPDGDPAEAILVVSVDEDGRARGFIGDRMPEQVVEQPFEPGTWRTDEQRRLSMFQGVRDHFCDTEPTIEDVIRELGPPEGSGDYDPPRWTLGVTRYHFNRRAGSTRAYYKPSERYPACSYRGAVSPLPLGWRLETETFRAPDDSVAPRSD